MAYNDGRVLVGKTLTGITVSDNKESIVFHTVEGDVNVSAYGDCCSQSWVENLEMPALGFPAKVLLVHDLDLPEDYYKRHPGPPEEDCLRLYGTEIVTDKGSITIDYRNESNGYYGGWLEWPSKEG